MVSGRVDAFIQRPAGSFTSRHTVDIVPILAILKEREPRYQQIRAKAQRQPGGKPALRSVKSSASAPAAETDEELAPASTGAVSTAAATRVTARQATSQRPRPKKKKTSAKQRRRR